MLGKSSLPLEYIIIMQILYFVHSSKFYSYFFAF